MMSTADASEGRQRKCLLPAAARRWHGEHRCATSAGSYILVDGQSDGKVKAELGDDPDKTGVYSFSFTLHNLEQEERRFALSAELFTQAVVEGYANHKQSEEEMALFQSTSTTPLMALATWTVDGQLVNSAGDADNWDFNGDGKTDADDAQALLDFVTGARQTIENDPYADLNGDGEVSTYDVHLFLKRLGRDSVTLPAHGSVEISSRCALPMPRSRSWTHFTPVALLSRA